MDSIHLAQNMDQPWALANMLADLQNEHKA
jgi:hypothetical protein